MVRDSLDNFRKKDLKHTAMAGGRATAYCSDCKRRVTPKGANVWIFLILVILGIVLLPILFGAFLLLIAFVYWLKYYSKGGRCPICNGSKLKYKE